MSKLVLALAIIVLAIAIVFAALLLTDSDTEIPILSDLLGTATPETGDSGSDTPDATQIAVQTPTSQPSATTTSPTAVVPTTQPAGPANAVEFASDPVRITDISTGAFDPAWNPTGESVAYLLWKSEGPCANRCADIGVVDPDGENQGVLATGPGPAGDIGIGGHIAWVGQTNVLLTNERNVFHEYMAIDATQAPFSRTAFDGEDAAFTKLLHIPGGMGGDGITASRDGRMVLWRHREGATGPVSLRLAPYNTLTGQDTNAVGTVLMTDSTDAAAFANGVALSPGGERYAFTWSANSEGGTDLYIADGVPGGQLRRLTTTGDGGFTNRAPAFSPNGQFILFDALSDGQYDLWIVNVETEEVTRLTDTPGLHEANATWAPDGKNIAFQMSGEGMPTNIYVVELLFGELQNASSSTPDQQPDVSGDPQLVLPLEGSIAFTRSSPDFLSESIYTMNADGTDQSVLIEDENYNSHPVLSPDGSKIAYRVFGDVEVGIKVANADGSNAEMLVEFGFNPAWSPDSSMLAYSRVGTLATEYFEIFVIELDGLESTRITFLDSTSIAPVWSPDGSKLAFGQWNDEEHEIFVINRDGTGLVKITTSTDGYASSPAWSPDGTQIAFNSERDIHVVNADGSDPVQLTDSSTLDIEPDWSPNGKHIVFTSPDENSNYQIWVMNSDGTGKTQLTSGEFENSQPNWIR